MAEEEPWYTVRCIFRHSQDGASHLYEERILLVKASSFDEAVERAESEAAEYVSNLGNAEYLGDANAFHVAVENVEDLTEIFSLMRESQLEPDEYVTTFFQTGHERSR